jgi:hypothetical protein
MKYTLFLAVLLLPLQYNSANEYVDRFCEKMSFECPPKEEFKNKLSENEYLLKYHYQPLQQASYRSTMIKHAADITVEAGYEKFIMYQGQSTKQRFFLRVFMFNTESEIPEEHKKLNRLNAKEYSGKHFTPIGSNPHAA